jgi:1-deoxyxylulose-5-phosphate synthase
LKRNVITSAIVGATRAEQLKESLSGYDIDLDEEEMAACNDVWFELPRNRDPRIALR